MAGVNVLGEPLEPCGFAPLTGFWRDGSCRTGGEDVGVHAVCAVMTAEFLEFSASVGNDLSTPIPEYAFPGLTHGDRWCLCCLRWKEAFEAGLAPQVVLEATHISVLEFVDHRAVIEQAKGVLVQLYSVDADTAWALLRAFSADTNRKVREIARVLVDAASADRTPTKHRAGSAHMNELIALSQPSGSVPYSPHLVVAYEPVWAIGTGQAASGRQAAEVANLIRQELTAMLGQSRSEAVRILYGGSVSPTNIAEFVQQKNIDGALVGGASLKADDFAGIIRATGAVKSSEATA